MAVNYQARDFQSIKESLIEYARQNFPGWTDFNESEQGLILIELYALVGDSLHYYIDRQIDEWDIDRVTQRTNAQALLSLIGYKMAGATAATAEVVFTIPAPATKPVPIPKGFKIYTRDVRNPIVYEVLEEGKRIESGQTSVTVTATQGETYEQFATFNGSADQQVTLEVAPYLEGSAKMTIGTEEWTEVENLLDSRSTDRHFYVEIDEKERAVLRFGDGIAGAAPNGTARITYRVGGGSAGRVGPNTLIVPESPQLLDLDGVPVTISVTNPSGSVGGEDKEPISVARVRGPYSLKSNNRTVAAPDFENHAMEVEGVSRALCRYNRIDPSIPENVIRLYIVPTGGGTASAELLQAVRDYIENEKPAPLTMVVDPQPAKYKTIDVTAEIVVSPGYDAATVKAAAQEAIQQWLSDYAAKYTGPDGQELTDYVLDFGMTVYPDDLAIKVPGCRSIKITSPSEPVVCAADEIPAPGTITVV